MFGRGAMTRAATDASIGKTLYFLASAMNICFISLTFSGYLAATFSLWLKSLLRLKSSSTWLLSGSVLAGPKASQGARLTFVLRNQPSWYSAHWPIISKYWVLCRDGILAFFA